MNDFGETKKEILEIFSENDIQYIEAVLICLDICRFTAIDSGFPFEKFKKMMIEQIDDYEENWPIG